MRRDRGGERDRMACRNRYADDRAGGLTERDSPAVRGPEVDHGGRCEPECDRVALSRRVDDMGGDCDARGHGMTSCGRETDNGAGR